MPLPYENTTTGDKALTEIQKILSRFGCTKFGTMTDTQEGSITVQFEHRGRMVSVTASSKGYAAAWLKEHPWSSRTRKTHKQHEKRALSIGEIAVFSILRDWIKGQITAIECGVISFEGAFLGQILLPSGKTILEEAEAKKMLPPPADE